MSAHGASARAPTRLPAYDADLVIYRLEEAGMTLLALPHTGPSTQLRQSRIEIVRTALDAYGWNPERARPAVPDAIKIDRMDEALGWITLIPRERYVLRRIVGAALAGQPDDRAAPVQLAPPRRGARRRPQGSQAVAHRGDRADGDGTEPARGLAPG